ncbi:MAG: hypothetical protein HRT57_02200 [Crocinitomicaceae bacterium]|nr:hypothetical protein [Crocinitomicaceae bacterium]
MKKKSILLFLLSLSSLISFSQITKGRYFNEINGTIWQSSQIIDQLTISESKGVGLIIVGIEIDSITTNTTLWFFDDNLRIESFNAVTKDRKTILECKYEHNKDTHTLKLFLVNGEIEFSYSTISIGNYVGLTRKKK